MALRRKAKLAFDNPYLVLGRFYDIYFRWLRNHSGDDLFAEEWDNLVMLDGCRRDTLQETDQFEASVNSRQSPGSQTLEFLQETIEGRSFPETVYVTANPQITKIDAEFADIIPLWDTAWNDEYETVLPESVVEAGLTAHKQYPDKRLWIHFVQPHIPFIGETGRSISQPSFQGGVIGEGMSNKPGVWAQIERGEITVETALRAYRENLELVLPHAMTLVDQLDGKSVITSDHGNGFGEWGIYGHDPYRHIAQLTTVPWVEFDAERRNVRPSDRICSSRELDVGTVSERLQHLGYLE